MIFIYYITQIFYLFKNTLKITYMIISNKNQGYS